MMRKIIKLQDTENGVALMLPDEMLGNLGVKIGDWLKVTETERGFLLTKDAERADESRQSGVDKT